MRWSHKHFVDPTGEKAKLKKARRGVPIYRPGKVITSETAIGGSGPFRI